MYLFFLLNIYNKSLKVNTNFILFYFLCRRSVYPFKSYKSHWSATGNHQQIPSENKNHQQTAWARISVLVPCYFPFASSVHFFPLPQRHMEVSSTTAICCLIAVPVVLLWAWKLLNWLWLRPKRLERMLRAQGLQGNPYRLLVGDSMEMFKMIKEGAKSKQPMSLSNDKDVAPHVFSFIHHTVHKFGMCISYFSY